MTSKYSTLPDIDTAPDLYETPDYPTLSTATELNDSDEDSPAFHTPYEGTEGEGGEREEGVVRGGVNFNEAKKRFAGARGGYRGLPAPTSYSYLPKATYSLNPIVNSSISAETETKLERFHRLKFEVEELESILLLEKLQEEAIAQKEVEKGENGGGKKEISAKILLQQLKFLKSNLGEISVELPDTIAGEQSRMEKVSKSLDLFKGDKNTAGGGVGVGSTSNGNDREAASIEDGELERRITELEKLIGISEATIDESNPLPPPLQKTLQKLETLLTVLTQPRHLDTISKRVKLLVHDLERLVDARKKLGDNRSLEIALNSGITVISDDLQTKPNSPNSKPSVAIEGIITEGGEGLGIDQMQKINAIFSLLPRIDPLLNLTPKLLSRLKSLSSLHSNALEFSNTLLELKDSVEGVEGGQGEIKVILKTLEEGMEGNEKLVKGNLEGIEGRLVGLMERMDKLGV